MNKNVGKHNGVCPLLHQWGIGVTSLALSLAAAPALKAQGLWIHGTYSPRTANTPATNNPVPPSAPAPTPAPAPAAQPSASQPAPATTPPASPPPAGSLETTLPPPTLQAPKPKNNEVEASGDFLFGQGTVTYPFGYSLAKSLNVSPNGLVSSFSVPRNATYYGGTLSYSYKHVWFVDFSFSKGNSSGSEDLPYQVLGTLPSSFSIDDTWYQFYLRYQFLQQGKWSAYIRAGATYVTADLKDSATFPNSSQYTQTDNTDEIQGNLGFGVGYILHSTRRLQVSLQFEGEGFYGKRTQKSLENLSFDVGTPFQSANIDNNLYGGIGRLTARLDYRLSRTSLFKIFGEAGIEGRYLAIDYPNSGGSQTESLWGPYVKLGLHYAF